MKGISVLNIVLLLIILGMAIYELWSWIMCKRSAKMIDQETFQAGMRKAQVLDLREKSTFDAGHILGARSIPYPMLKEYIGSLRKDKPIYLYDQRRGLTTRAANLLRKKGFKEIYILKGGYERWQGKIKKK